MLENQVFSRPIVVGVSSTLFADPENPVGVDFNFISVFRTQIQNVAGYSFIFLDDKKAPVADMDQFLALLSGFGIVFQSSIIYDKSDAQQLAQLNAAFTVFDLIYAPNLTVQTPGIIYRDRVSELPPRGFLQCLLSLVALPCPFSLTNFRSLENQWLDTQQRIARNP